MVLGQVVTFPRTKFIIAVLLRIVNRMAINYRFVINMIMSITVFAQCSNGGSAHYIFM